MPLSTPPEEQLLGETGMGATSQARVASGDY